MNASHYPSCKDGTSSGASNATSSSRGGTHMAQQADDDLLGALKATSSSDAAESSFVGLERDIVQAFQRTSPSVAQIVAYEEPRGNPISKLFDRYRTSFSVECDYGSGFMWDGEHVVTAYHVLAREYGFFRKGISISPRLTVLVDLIGVPTRIEAEVVGGDAQKDIAVLRLLLEGSRKDGILLYNEDGSEFGDDTKGQQLPQPLQLGNSRSLKVGQSVLAVASLIDGHHGGTLKTGTVSEIGGHVKSTEIQTDFHGCIVVDGELRLARRLTTLTRTPNRLRLLSSLFSAGFLRNGFSGGPLLDSQARLIGVNIGTFGDVGDSAVAVPVDTVARIVNQIIQHGESFDPVLGITGTIVRVSRNDKYRTGVLVARVIPNSPAANAGLEGAACTRKSDIFVEDVIMGIDGTLITTMGDFKTALDAKQEGEVVELSISRIREHTEIIEIILVEVTIEKLLKRRVFDAKTTSKKEWAKIASATEAKGYILHEM